MLVDGPLGPVINSTSLIIVQYVHAYQLFLDWLFVGHLYLFKP